jgi:hypothetical protein
MITEVDGLVTMEMLDADRRLAMRIKRQKITYQ